MNAYLRRAAGNDVDGEFYRGQLSLAAAIQVAGMARAPNGKRHGHQRRQPEPSLATFTQRLRARRADLPRCRTFAELHDVVQAASTEPSKIPMIGPLCVYDAAHRIGLFLGLEPDLVYLHAGAEKGAAALGFRRRASLAVHELPPEFHRLQPWQVEDCLCIFKDDLQAIARQ